jgi:hypothetical protein
LPSTPNLAVIPPSMASMATAPNSIAGKALLLLYQLASRVLTTPASTSVVTTGNGSSSELDTAAGSNRLYTKAWSRVSLSGTAAHGPTVYRYTTSPHPETSTQGAGSHEALAQQVAALYQVGNLLDPFNVFPRFQNRRLNALHLIEASKCTLCSLTFPHLLLPGEGPY